MGSSDEQLTKKEQHEILLAVHGALLNMPVVIGTEDRHRNIMNLVAHVANAIGKERTDESDG